MKSAALTVSPWATIESSSLDPATGIIDLSNQPTITVIAQNGTDKTVYQTSLELPDLLPQGVGYTASLFGFKSIQMTHMDLRLERTVQWLLLTTI